ncbi:MAG: ribosome-binding factor A [Gammaproteobacteria bacterium]|jgi:ribosome-binding factor A
MPREFKRTVRVAESIKRVVAPLLNDWMRENQAGMASVTNATVSSDMRQSKIYVSLYGCDDATATLKSINEARYQFRQSIGHELSLRNLPEIKFFRDDSIESSDNISRMLGRLNDGDGDV